MSDSPVAIVTGGAQGIGEAICVELLKKGYKVCAGDIQESKLKEVVKKQQGIFGKENVMAMECDVSKETAYQRIFELTMKTFKRVDVLVNNAGVLHEHDPRYCLEVNLIGPLVGCHTAFKYMGKSNGGNGGVVINNSSIAGFIPVAEIPSYVASKHGLIGMTRSFGLPMHFDKDGITFAAICPYYVDTPILNTLNKTLDPKLDSSKYPDKMSPEFVAKGALKILEDKINGSTLLISPEGYHYRELEEDLKKFIPRR